MPDNTPRADRNRRIDDILTNVVGGALMSICAMDAASAVHRGHDQISSLALLLLALLARWWPKAER